MMCGEVAAARGVRASAFQSCLDLCEHPCDVCGAVALHNALSPLLSPSRSSVLIKMNHKLCQNEDDDLVRNSRDGVGGCARAS